MKLETRIFVWLVPFFVIVAAVYAATTAWEPVGTIALLLLGGLVGMIGVYFGMLAKRIQPRPEDDPRAEIEEGAGDYGVFSPWSWWPLVLGLAAALFFTGMAAGWWISYIGAGVAVIGLVGWVFEFSRGHQAH